MSLPRVNSSGSGSNSSESTIEDVDLAAWNFGHPLERTPRHEWTEEEATSLADVLAPMMYNNGHNSSSESVASSSSSVVYDIDFEALIDQLIIREPLVAKPNSFTFLEPSTNEANDSLMIKCLLRTAPELALVLELNHAHFRSDPWNPVPHIIYAVERGDKVFLCMERLVECDQPPLKTVANYIDFFRQVLEGLSFFHEHRIANLSCYDPRSFMMAIGVCPSQLEYFDRASSPVRYCHVNLSKAIQIATTSKGSLAVFRRDVQDVGRLFKRVLADIPVIQPKLNTLVSAMASGEFGANEARKSFEVLCKSIEPSLYGTLVPANHKVKWRSAVYGRPEKLLCL